MHARRRDGPHPPGKAVRAALERSLACHRRGGLVEAQPADRPRPAGARTCQSVRARTTEHAVGGRYRSLAVPTTGLACGGGLMCGRGARSRLGGIYRDTHPIRVPRERPAIRRGGARTQNVRWHEGNVDRAARWAWTGQHGATIWFTGLSGSGKSRSPRPSRSGSSAPGLGLPARWRQPAPRRVRDLGFSARRPRRNVRRVAELACSSPTPARCDRAPGLPVRGRPRARERAA